MSNTDIALLLNSSISATASLEYTGFIAILSPLIACTDYIFTNCFSN